MGIFYTKVLTNRFAGILFRPAKTWNAIKKESGYVVESFAFLFICCVIVGLFSFVKKQSGWFPELFIPFFSILISSILIRFLKEIKKINWECSFNLIVFSFFPLLLLYALSFIVGSRQILIPLGVVYSLILLIVASKIALNLTLLNALSISSKIFLIILACLYSLMVLF